MPSTAIGTLRFSITVAGVLALERAARTNGGAEPALPLACIAVEMALREIVAHRAHRAGLRIQRARRLRVVELLLGPSNPPSHLRLCGTPAVFDRRDAVLDRLFRRLLQDGIYRREHAAPLRRSAANFSTSSFRTCPLIANICFISDRWSGDLGLFALMLAWSIALVDIIDRTMLRRAIARSRFTVGA